MSDSEYNKLKQAWYGMRSRCFNKKSKKYPRYGNRGITVCDEWVMSFQTFYTWAVNNGHAMDLTLDREDNDGDYTPTNCRWASNYVQSHNRCDDRIGKSGYIGVCETIHGTFKATVRMGPKRQYVRTCKTASLASLHRNLFIIVNKLPHRINPYAARESCFQMVSDAQKL